MAKHAVISCGYEMQETPNLVRFVLGPASKGRFGNEVGDIGARERVEISKIKSVWERPWDTVDEQGKQKEGNQKKASPKQIAERLWHNHDFSNSVTTEDGHFAIIKGRKWRATDPLIPEKRAAELRKALMAARRAVKHAASKEETTAARTRVQAAKVALGERGTPPWWEQTDDERRARWSAEV
ncbi:hypothetical protein CONPUDRAFT_164189 [Coniophora puteana RWD-64-598 SS2]|uniref:Uncharacterized protein n=1 Tax=Coniophora puteana (strain RWD-64-598) TaxID=741705 RepID=A0A5M3MVP1_CONPW|nr:uncharacterized protein CONPUDRAFT_164189 [Coniophora puteana RWD-64-598 SS2]EIW83203.1 hypothetical protein CONPUDRAFT_164189 [Coniophora puteana RWD-64-598 SS2]